MTMTFFQLPGIMELIRAELPKDVREKALIKKMENLFVTSYKPEYLTETQQRSGELAARILLYAGLLDAALSKKAKYVPEKYGCEKEWEPAVRWLKFELTRTKLFSGIMIHNVSKLCSLAYDSLQCVNPDSCGQALVSWAKQNGESLTDLYDIIIGIGQHLKELTEYYERYQYSLVPD